eukprot:gene11806-5140_t
MYTELINKIKEENIERIRNAFEEVCLLGNKDDITEFVKSFDIDINYDDGYPMENIACRNDLELFKVIAELGGDVNLNNSSCLRIFASKGNLEAVKYIIEELGCDHGPIFGTTALNNYDYIKEYIYNLPPPKFEYKKGETDGIEYYWLETPPGYNFIETLKVVKNSDKEELNDDEKEFIVIINNKFAKLKIKAKLQECSEEVYKKMDDTDYIEIDQFIAQTEDEIVKKRSIDDYKININFNPVNTYSKIELEIMQSKRENPYYSVEDEFDEDDGELDRILQEDYEENKEFYEELARKYGE